MEETYDFSGWATRNDLKCADGRVIRRNAFKDDDGRKVPLVWQHNHKGIENVIGHAILENRDEGVYAYCSLNDTPNGKHAKEIIRHGDVEALSIYANGLKQQGSDVFHGVIRELSLVLAGANPGAYIEEVELAHGEGFSDTDAIIYNGEELPELYHSAEDDEEDEEKKKKKEDEEESEESNDDNESEDNAEEETNDDDSEEDEDMEEKKKLSHAAEGENKTVQEIYDNMTEEQQLACAAIAAAAVDEATGKKSDEDEEGGEEMKHNVFDQGSETTLAHAVDFTALLAEAQKNGSLKDAVLSHAAEFEEDIDEFIAHAYPKNEDGTDQTYGVANIGWLFPEARMATPTPEWIKRDTDWVAGVINGVHHTPFSRIKSMFADITEDEARAKGYIKGKKKTEEVFSLLKRSTTPQTIYKKQKLDRDDIIDITDFDVVAWIKAEMRMMLDEEIARAILVGDGRSIASDDHISHEHVRPIWLDDELYTIRHTVAGETDKEKATNLIDDAVRARIGYKGSGSPTLYTTEQWITEMLLLKDEMGHRLYKTMEELATAMRVVKIVPVPVLEGLTRTVGEGQDAHTYELAGIIINLKDYTVGADKGGAISLFDQFDIDYNQQKYLIETRISGAMTKPKAAIALEFDVTESF